jgi:hypothetical protein
MTHLVLVRHIRRKPTSTDSLSFRTSLGRFKLEITAKGFQPYSADVYMPSDFAGNWAVQLKAEAPKRP